MSYIIEIHAVFCYPLMLQSTIQIEFIFIFLYTARGGGWVFPSKQTDWDVLLGFSFFVVGLKKRDDQGVIVEGGSPACKAGH